MGRKSEKRNLYTDTREEEEEEKRKDDMAGWDEEKLRLVVMSKHGNPKTTTDKVCKFFIEAVEIGKYGWFWSCPNGGDKCMYRHSLPPGYAFPPFPIFLILPSFPPRTTTQPRQITVFRQANIRQVHTPNPHPTPRRKSPPREIPPQDPNPRRLPRDVAASTNRHADARHPGVVCEMEEGAPGQEGGGG